MFDARARAPRDSRSSVGATELRMSTKAIEPRGNMKEMPVEGRQLQSESLRPASSDEQSRDSLRLQTQESLLEIDLHRIEHNRRNLLREHRNLSAGRGYDAIHLVNGNAEPVAAQFPSRGGKSFLDKIEIPPPGSIPMPQGLPPPIESSDGLQPPEVAHAPARSMTSVGRPSSRGSESSESKPQEMYHLDQNQQSEPIVSTGMPRSLARRAAVQRAGTDTERRYQERPIERREDGRDRSVHGTAVHIAPGPFDALLREAGGATSSAVRGKLQAVTPTAAAARKETGVQVQPRVGTQSQSQAIKDEKH